MPELLQVYGGSEMPFLFKLLLFIFIALFVIRLLNAKPISETYDHQHRHFENLTFSAQDFYHSLEGAVKEKGYPHVRAGRITFSEGGVMSGNREYLRISRHHMVFDVCAAPFGKDFFVSWWVGETPDGVRNIIAAIPWIGKAIERAVYKKSLYLVDTEIMFRESVNRIVEEAIAAMTEAKGWRSIQERARLTVPAIKDDSV